MYERRASASAPRTMQSHEVLRSMYTFQEIVRDEGVRAQLIEATSSLETRLRSHPSEDGDAELYAPVLSAASVSLALRPFSAELARNAATRFGLWQLCRAARSFKQPGACCACGNARAPLVLCGACANESSVCGPCYSGWFGLQRESGYGQHPVCLTCSAPLTAASLAGGGFPEDAAGFISGCTAASLAADDAAYIEATRRAVLPFVNSIAAKVALVRDREATCYTSQQQVQLLKVQIHNDIVTLATARLSDFKGAGSLKCSASASVPKPARLRPCPLALPSVPLSFAVEGFCDAERAVLYAEFLADRHPAPAADAADELETRCRLARVQLLLGKRKPWSGGSEPYSEEDYAAELEQAEREMVEEHAPEIVRTHFARFVLAAASLLVHAALEEDRRALVALLGDAWSAMRLEFDAAGCAEWAAGRRLQEFRWEPPLLLEGEEDDEFARALAKYALVRC